MTGHWEHASPAIGRRSQASSTQRDASAVVQHLYPEGRPRSPEETAAWLQYTLASYEQLALGYLAILRKEDGALIDVAG